jgi:hypothetical protein
MSNIIDLSAFKGVRSPKRVLHSENDELIEPRSAAAAGAACTLSCFAVTP